MLLRKSLQSCLLALLVAQAVASNHRRQTPSADVTPAPSTPAASGGAGGSGAPGGSAGTGRASSTTEQATQPSDSAVDTRSSHSVTPNPNTPSSTPTPTPEAPVTAPSSETTAGGGAVIVSGSDVIIIETQVKNGTSSALPSATAKDTSEESHSGSSGVGTGSIIGMSVAGGLAVIGIIAFFVWKFTRKKFSAFDDNEPIKWPDLNSHGGAADTHPLPVRDTGRAGIDTGSDGDLTRMTDNYSTSDFASHQDPYAVPPLPHLNPNQPYRDDPGYYDPYRGPLPATVEHGGDWAGEAIPMNQMHQHQAPYSGRQSPGPMNAYDPSHNAGRQSPGPMNAYDQQQMSYNAGRQSPGPVNAYGAGRASPGPEVGYQNYDVQGNGRQSPGPMTAYGGGGAQGNAATYNSGYDAGYGQAPPGYGAQR